MASMTEPAGETSPASDMQRRGALAQAHAVRLDPAAWLKAIGAVAVEQPLDAAAAARLADALLVLPPTSTPHSQALAFDVLRATVLDPVYQLK